MPSTQQRTAFFNGLWTYYDTHRRDLPWRQTTDPYAILVSEIMLQQTQVQRVIPKYQAFLRQFPTYKQLADATLAEVLQVWSGLGYNRRAKYLWQAAQRLTDLKSFPSTVDELVQLPGVGINTAGAVITYAFNQPVVFIETNVRTVLLHHFFAGQTNVSDTQLQTVLQDLLAEQPRSPRDFYWALMDYGSYLKTIQPNPGRRSKHYAKQSVFQGSKRQIRGQVLRSLQESARNTKQLRLAIPDERLDQVLVDLVNEKLISRQVLKGKTVYQLYTS